MNKEKILQAAVSFARQELEKDASGHDWWHIYRVAQTSKTIAKEERADLFICELAAWLHDIADEKITGNEQAGLEKVKTWMQDQEVDEPTIEHVMDIISSMSFKGGGKPPMRSIEGQVVQDADRLDAIGAVGIARVFAYSGAKARLIHDPENRPRENMTSEEYRQGKSTGINHFYEKLLKLKDLMNTDYAKKLAEERHQFMVSYLEQFYSEWEGKA
ncbi:HD domain-containing protein [Ammoniphilus sp. CFH 90114]|uniref:HD domain-containing protein n=1 Tax=Ammoniphilus sp. CFH 90114 TaxID=2493665 RepID=UPI00100F0322|nr:HD domain-containing protein [Ammoniphilus sp. CFH 90114]RXT04893.1 HD domain-containing protein [Ammoniphilus sp. CFH 90114]